ncbi:hypothetical protein Tco_0506840, partial [Tanacetum coccineum]
LYKDTMCYVNIFHVMPRVSALAGCDTLIADEDAMDKEVTVKVKDHKRKHDSDDDEDDDDDEGPSAGSNQGRSANRRRPVGNTKSVGHFQSCNKS